MGDAAKLPPGASVTNQRGKWIGRVRLPDQTRPGFTLGPSTGPDAMTNERAVEKFAAWLERGFVARVMAQKAAPEDLGKPAKPTTIGDVVKLWTALVEADTRLAPATRKGHVATASGPIVVRFGTRTPESLTSGDLRAWLRELRAAVSTSRTRSVFFTLSKMLDDAAAEDWIACANPCRLPKVREDIPAVHVPEDDDKAHHTEDEARRIIEATEDPARRLRYMVAFTSLMRDGEIAGLRWADLDTLHGVLVYRIRGALAREGDDGWATRRTTKTTAGRRNVPVHPDVAVELDRWRAEGWRALVGRDPTEEDSIFVNAKGEPWRPRSSEHFKADLEAAGLPTTFQGEPFEFRSTRRSGATWLEAKGASGEHIDRIMGHASASVRRKHYSAPDLEAMARAVALIEVTGQRRGQQAPSEAGPESRTPVVSPRKRSVGWRRPRSSKLRNRARTSADPQENDPRGVVNGAPNPLLSGALSSDGSEAEAVGRFVLGELAGGLYDLRRDPLNAYSYHDVDDDGGDDGSA